MSGRKKRRFVGAGMGFLALLWSSSIGAASPSHQLLDQLLERHVRDGRVDYAALAGEVAQLDRYLEGLAAVDLAEVGKEGRGAQLALWINAYNAFTLRLILRHYREIDSIRDIGGPWKTEEWNVGGRILSLDEIEHGILRRFDEPRIHFALVCASLGCPDLRDHAFTGDGIDRELDAAARTFFASRKGLRFEHEAGRRPELTLSAILKWYEDDFRRDGGDVVDFILPYLESDLRGRIERSRDSLRVRHADYDWGLNDIDRSGGR